MRNFKVCSLPFEVRMIKSRRLKSGGHIVRMEAGRSASKMLTGKPIGYTCKKV